MSEALALKNVTRAFTQGEGALEVLKGADLTINEGEIVALVGASGTGKSTLLHIAGLLEPPDDGEVMIAGENASDLSDEKRTELRLSHLGFVYQFHHLLPEFSAAENILLPQMVKGVARAPGLERAKDLLASMGLSDRADNRPGQLSGGEQQRVAIARALANAPKLLLADEPTGNLDPGTAASVFDQLMKLVRDEKLAALIATHNPELAKRMDRTVTLVDGKVEEVQP